MYFCSGEMAERSNAAVLKTVVLAMGPGVRIPLSPPAVRRKTAKNPENHVFPGFFISSHEAKNGIKIT